MIESLGMVTASMILKDSCSLEEKLWQTQTVYWKEIAFCWQNLYIQSYGFSSSHVWMWELNNKEGWASKNWCIQIVVLEKTLESLLDSKEIKSVNSKGNQPWIFIGRTDAEAPILWPPDVKNWLIWKDLNAGKDWRQEEKGTLEDEMVGWHHWLDGHEFEQAPGFGDGQGSLACYRPWDRKELVMTEQLNWTLLNKCDLSLPLGQCLLSYWCLKPLGALLLLSPLSTPWRKEVGLSSLRWGGSGPCLGHNSHLMKTFARWARLKAKQSHWCVGRCRQKKKKKNVAVG